ncbi:hypothetical protein ORS3428_29430 [Mesorhizobium sp. ORS 3428]|nr:hypothetical protein ORS3428_29430 [Mesorhizobium sp. ORS 3428]
MRKLDEIEVVGLIGYPCDGEYIAVVDSSGDSDWLLGGELCRLNGVTLTHQAAVLLKYYPNGTRLVIATIEGDSVVAIRKYLPATEKGVLSMNAANEEKLETAAPSTEDTPHAYFRAAAMLRDSAPISFDTSTEMALSAIAAKMNLGRLDVIRIALREWLAMHESARFPTDESA